MYVYLISPVLMVADVPAQTSVPLNFESLTINNGLSQGFVSSITQDKKGLMWFATGDGLNKYDGAAFTIYHHDSDDPTSMASDDITCIFEDSKERLWIGNRSNGIDLFDRERNVFMHIHHTNANSLRSDNILDITEDKTGALWIRTQGGIDRMEIAALPAPPGKFALHHVDVKYALLFTHIELNNAREVAEVKFGPEKVFIDSRDHIFLTTNNSLWELTYNARLHSYRLAQKYTFAVKDSAFIPDLLEDTTHDCLLLNKGEIIRFTHYDFGSPREIFQYAPFQVHWILDRKERLWIADKNRIVQLNITSGNVQYAVTTNALQIHAINSPTFFYIDRSGVVWIATGGYGVLKYDPEAEHFHHILPQSYTYQLLESDTGQIITNSFQMVTIKKNQPVEVDRLIDQALLKKKFPKVGVMSFAKDHAGNLWVGINGSVIKYSLKNKKAIRYNLPDYEMSTLPFPVFADRMNNIWMGYNKYFVRYNPSSGKFTKYDYLVKSKSYDYDFLQCIYEDNGVLWLGSVNGLFSFNVNTERMKHYYTHQQADTASISNNFILSFCNDMYQPAKYLWIGTKGGGLNRLDKTTGNFMHYNTKNGLANNTVYGILTDNNGTLWLSTNKGLSAFNPATRHFSNFSVSDGLQSNEFNRYAYCKTSEGILVFGGINGINYFDPNDIRPLEPPEVMFTDFRLFNKSVDFKTSGSPLKKDIGYTREVVLRYEQNVVTLQFAAMDYRKNGNIRYRYLMKGFDKVWIYSGNSREATYTNLDPGKYQFIVQGSFENGKWGRQQTTMGLVVIPPWWRTWWFYILATTATMWVMYALYRYRLYQHTRLDSLRNRIARDLHDEVGSSISTIAIYSKILHEQVGSTTFNNEPLLKKVTDYATEIMESMDDIVWNINTKNDGFEHIISRMREHAYQLFGAKGYLLHFNFDDNLLRMKLVMEKRRDFYLIYKEALNNIAKYANGKNVWITLVLNNTNINLAIKDDGKGFDIKAVRKSSNGLNNMDYRAKALNGKITIISTPGTGTEIHLSF